MLKTISDFSPLRITNGAGDSGRGGVGIRSSAQCFCVGSFSSSLESVDDGYLFLPVVSYYSTSLLWPFDDVHKEFRCLGRGFCGCRMALA